MRLSGLLLALFVLPAQAGVVRVPARPLKIVIAGAESVPFIKTGGLADVIDATHRGYASLGHSATLFLPRYPQIDKALLQDTGLTVEVPVAGRVETAQLMKAVRGDGAEIYFLDNPAMYSETAPYAPKGAYDDTDERFIFFSRGVIETVKKLGLSPDVFHVHDWHAALIPAMVEKDPAFKKAVSVTTIHNIAYQGVFDQPTLVKAGLDPEDFRFDRYEYYGKFSLLKAGLVASDGITTVSPTYAREIQESGEKGRGLEGLLAWRSADLRGIINGIDGSLHDPRTDAAIAQTYGVDTAALGKELNKAALQKAGALRGDKDAPLFMMATRLDSQKGVDLVLESAALIARLGGQLLIVGSGDKGYESELARLMKAYPGTVFHHPFSEVFVRLAYAGADFLLMPSRFEPGGLSQLIAQRYGTLPIVNPTGGLRDTVTEGDGIVMREFSLAAMQDALAHAFALYHAPGLLERARATAMRLDRSWAPSINKYLDFFYELLDRKNK